MGVTQYPFENAFLEHNDSGTNPLHKDGKIPLYDLYLKNDINLCKLICDSLIKYKWFRIAHLALESV